MKTAPSVAKVLGVLSVAMFLAGVPVLTMVVRSARHLPVLNSFMTAVWICLALQQVIQFLLAFRAHKSRKILAGLVLFGIAATALAMRELLAAGSEIVQITFAATALALIVSAGALFAIDVRERRALNTSR